MAFNSKKVEEMVRARGIKAKDFFKFAYPDRSGNVDYKAISKNKNPGAEVVERIADLLQCSIDELFDREPQYPTSGDHIEASENSTAFKGTYSCDPRLLDIIEKQSCQIDRAQEHLTKAQQQIDQLIELYHR